jgi:type IV pilus assembly protein PilV
MLIEVLIAILVFSIGILAVVGMQGVAISNVTDARNRSEAAFLASELLSQIWADTPNIASYAYSGSGGPPARLAPWVTRVGQQLPGTLAVPPIVTVTADPTLGTVVTIRVRWQMPGEASTPRKHDLVATINVNP